MSSYQRKKVKLEGKKLEYKNKYKYLGQILATEKRVTLELNIRITKACRSFWTLKSFFKSKNVPKYKHSKQLCHTHFDTWGTYLRIN